LAGARKSYENMTDPEGQARPTDQTEAQTGTDATGAGSEQAGKPAISNVTRLLVGAALLGWDTLSTVLDEAADDKSQEDDPPAGTVVASEAATRGSTSRISPPETQPPTATPTARQILIGMLFDTGERAGRTGSAVLRAGERMARPAARPASRWARRSRLLAPAQRRLDALAARGEEVVARWAARGQVEEARSRALFQTTMVETVDASLDRVAQNPQIQELVESQSASLGQEVMEELRERAVTGDMLVERAVGRVLNRPARQALPLAPGTDVLGAQTRISRPNLGGQPAGLVSRAVAYLIDIVAVTFSFAAAAWFAHSLQDFLDLGFVLLKLEPLLSPLTSLGLPLSGTSLFAIGYLLFFWTFGGKTPGKAVLGLRVVKAAGGRLSFLRAGLRLVGYMICVLSLYVGFLWVAVDRQQRSWADVLAGTRVIYTWEARPEEEFLAGELERLGQ
jgi:uncharacterized RDD family membrane protein YckC